MADHHHYIHGPRLIPRPVGGGASSGGPTGDGILLEDGSSFLLAETGDYLILE
jgi:hypothetical protein